MNNDKWNEIAYLLSENLPTDLSETDFGQKVIQGLRILDWKEYKGEIEKEHSLQFGSVNKLRPDFIIKSEDKRLFVIEIKLPTIPINSIFQRQLFSYMRQLKLEYGILIGQGIQIFYDGDLTELDDPVLLETIEFEKDSSKGLKFVELFSKQTFSYDLLKSYTLNSLKKINRKADQKKLRQKILSSEYHSELLEFIKQDFLNKYDAELIDNVLQEISVSIQPKQNLIDKKPKLQTYITNQTENKSSRDKTKYIINGTGARLPKNRFVLELVKAYLQKNPTDFSSLKRVFKDEYQGSTGVINKLDFVETKYANKSNKRHFTGKDEILTSADKIQFVVSTEWGKDNINNIVDLARENGFEIQKV